MQQNQFNPDSISVLKNCLQRIDPNLYPLYLSLLIGYLGENKCQFPTEINETSLLLAIKEAVPSLPTDIFIRTQKILTLSRKNRMRDANLFFALSCEVPPVVQRPPLIHVFADKKAIKSLEKARQGYYEAIRDIETHVMGTQKQGRVHEEEHGQVLCQADTSLNQWGSADRFVYGTDFTRTKALCVGHVKDHQRKGAKDYKIKKGFAKNVDDDSFDGKIFIPSEQIRNDAKQTAHRMIPPIHLSDRMIKLQKNYEIFTQDTNLEPEERKELFKMFFEEDLMRFGPLNETDITALPKDNPFRIDVEEMKQELYPYLFPKTNKASCPRLNANPKDAGR